MALEATLTLHENPFESVAAIWEKRQSFEDSKHRLRESKSVDGKTETIIAGKDDDDKDDYCILKAATKGPSSPQRRPILPSDYDIRTHLSSSSYNTFAKRHTGGSVRTAVGSTVTKQPRQARQAPGSTNYNNDSDDARFRTNAAQSKQSEEDVKVFCCGRTVESLIDSATCMCCVKGAMYHCTKDNYDEGDIEEEPCTCNQELPKRACVTRWLCMALCSLFLPCVLCYLPARGCLRICTCYKRHRIASARRRQHRIRDPHRV